jgi:hypothetical protein
MAEEQTLAKVQQLTTMQIVVVSMDGDETALDLAGTLTVRELSVEYAKVSGVPPSLARFYTIEEGEQVLPTSSIASLLGISKIGPLRLAVIIGQNEIPALIRLVQSYCDETSEFHAAYTLHNALREKELKSQAAGDFLNVWHCLPLPENSTKGLTSATAAALLVEHGRNEVSLPEPTQSISARLGITGKFPPPHASWWLQCQEEKKALEIVSTLRDSVMVDVPAAELVKGDIVFLTAGQTVHADIQVLASATCSNYGKYPDPTCAAEKEAGDQYGETLVDCSVLTGEPQPLRRSKGVTDKNLLESENVLLHSSTLVGGAVAGIVAATGARTVMGQIGSLMRCSLDIPPRLPLKFPARTAKRVFQVACKNRAIPTGPVPYTTH